MTETGTLESTQIPKHCKKFEKALKNTKILKKSSTYTWLVGF